MTILSSEKIYHVVVETTAWDRLAAFGTIAAAVAVLVTLLLGLVGFRRDNRNARNTAERAEAAARLSVDNSDKLVQALGEIARSFAAGGGGAIAIAEPKVTWLMTHDRGDTYRLTNTGTATAHDVSVTSDPTLGLVNAPTGVEIGPQEAATFLAAVTFGTTDLTITVTWTDDDGTERQWRYPLPAKR